MSKKNRKADQGTYALSITVGFFAGLGLAPMFNNGMMPPLIGIAVGIAVGYFIVHSSRTKKN
jgi:hypothetical protein